MDWTKYVSAIALVVSVGSFGLSYNLSHESAITSVRPVLVYQFDERKGWSVRNVGNGPALDVIVAMKKDDKADWTQPMRIPPLAKDGEFNLNKWDIYNNARTLGRHTVIFKRKFTQLPARMIYLRPMKEIYSELGRTLRSCVIGSHIGAESCEWLTSSSYGRILICAPLAPHRFNVTEHNGYQPS